eukprot:UN2273
MEEYYSSAEDLLDALDTLFKTAAKEAGGSVDYDEETEDALLTMDFAFGEVKVPILLSVKLDLEKNHITVKAFKGATADTETAYIYHWQAYEAPLRVGLWSERPDGSLLGGYIEACEATVRLNNLVSQRDVLKEINEMGDDVFF